MASRLPLYGQETNESCALACLRMVLAANGTFVEEHDLELQAATQAGGTHIQDLERLARRFGLLAQIEQVTPTQLRAIVEKGRLAITYVNRAFFDLPSLRHTRSAFTHPKVHAVIPIRVSEHYVTFHDPLDPPRIARRSILRFDRAHGFLGYATLVFD